MSVDHGSEVPPSRQVAEIIRERIRSGQIQPGDRIPGITAMMQEFEIARTTAGKVLALLQANDLITVVRGWASALPGTGP